MSSSLDRLEADPVLATVHQLVRRIRARFPARDLGRVAEELAALVAAVRDSSSVARGRVRVARVATRALAVAILVGTAVAFVLALRSALGDAARPQGLDWLPLLESTVNDLVFAAVALFFLVSFPERIERGDLLELLHRLRSLAHIIDMHALTKDPERLRASFRRTPESADPGLTRDEMEYYLDYCSELLSLVGKTAALCAQESRDQVVLDTVRSVEQLTTGMSHEIWQKIALLPR